MPDTRSSEKKRSIAIRPALSSGTSGITKMSISRTARRATSIGSLNQSWRGETRKAFIAGRERAGPFETDSGAGKGGRRVGRACPLENP